MVCFNPLAGIIFIWTECVITVTVYGPWSFNPLAGIIFIWTMANIPPIRTINLIRFNPLAGIIFIWTLLFAAPLGSAPTVSIPLRGLSLFGHANADPDPADATAGFNPLAGIIFIWTMRLRLTQAKQMLDVQKRFNPLAGIIFIWTDQTTGREYHERTVTVSIP
jgi:hypothetical protein